MEQQLIGFYHAHGYNLHVLEGGLLEQVYEAGNSPHDSDTTVPVKQGVGLETLHKYCEQTGREMARELGIPWAGCEKEEDPWDDEEDF
jgi:hypothetical protein